MSEFQQGTKVQPRDGADTPETSPLTVSSTVIALKVPKGAVEFDYWVENYAIRTSDVVAMTDYTKIPVGGDKFRCSNMDFIYLKRDGLNDATVHFRFNIN